MQRKDKYEHKRIKESMGRANNMNLKSLLMLKDYSRIKDMWKELKTNNNLIENERWEKITERDEIEKYIFEWTKYHINQASKCPLGNEKWDKILEPGNYFCSHLLKGGEISNRLQKEMKEWFEAIK